MNGELVVKTTMELFVPASAFLFGSWLGYLAVIRAVSCRGDTDGVIHFLRTLAKKRAVAALAGLCLGAGMWLLAVSFEFPLPPTEYGAGYTRRVFNSVRIGDPVESVKERLGEPLEMYEPATALVYSRPAGGRRHADHWQRWILLTGDGRTVKGKLSGFYWSF